MLVGEMTLETLTVEMNLEVNNPLLEVCPVETNQREQDGEGAADGSHVEQSGGANVEVRGWRGQIRN